MSFDFNFKVFTTGRGTERIQSRQWQWSNSTSLDRCKDAKINQHKQKVGPWLHDSSKGRGGWEERVTGAATLTKDYGRKSYFIQIFDMQYCQQVRIPISFVSPTGMKILKKDILNLESESANSFVCLLGLGAGAVSGVAIQDQSLLVPHL